MDPGDPVSTTAFILNVLTVSPRYRRILLDVRRLCPSPSQERLRETHGSVIARGVTILLPDTLLQWERINQLLTESEEVLFAFQRAYTSDCTQTAVAGAIIAQIAVTALSLPSLSQAHWVARALFVVSLVTGLLSVYFAVLLQRTIGALYRATDIRDWLSKPRQHLSLDKLSELQVDLVIAKQNFQENGSIWQSDIKTWRDFSLNSFPDDDQPVASFFSAQMLIVPEGLINMSLGSFLIGFAIYLGYLWTRSLDDDAGRGGSRNVFIVFVVCIFASWLFYLIPRTLKNRELFPFQLKWRLQGGFKALLDDATRKQMSSQQQTRGPDTIPVDHQPGTTGIRREDNHAQSTERAFDTNHDIERAYPNGNSGSPPKQAATQSTLGISREPALFPPQHDLLAALQQAMAAQEASARASSRVAEEYRKAISRLK